MHKLPVEICHYIVERDHVAVEKVRACFENLKEFTEYLGMLLELRLLLKNERIRHALSYRCCTMDVLQYLLGTGCGLPTDAAHMAVKSGNIECLMWMHTDVVMSELVRKSPGFLPQIAASEGQLAVLKYLHEQGFAWNSWTCAAAAEKGHLDCLKFAHENGCDWNSRTLQSAAVHGHLAYLAYAYEHGCRDWANTTRYFTCLVAANGHLQCLKYAHEHGCEWHDDVVNYALRHRQWACMIYAMRNGGDSGDLVTCGAHISCAISLVIIMRNTGHVSTLGASVVLVTQVYPLICRLLIIYGQKTPRLHLGAFVAVVAVCVAYWYCRLLLRTNLQHKLGRSTLSGR